ncbi:MAG: hypothetical protein ABI550_02490 [Ignavibacteriaceae bacterium]
MYKLFVSVLFLFCSLLFFSSTSFAQSSDSVQVVHVQTWKLKAAFTPEDGKAFSEVLRKQSEATTKDSRLLSLRVLRHYWGNDSRDLVIISEFKNIADLLSFNDDFNSMMEKAYSKEQLDKDNDLWTKYVGQHSDEIYREVAGTSK